MKQYFEQLFYSFPLQLLLSHVRSNVLLIGMWLLAALLITGKIGNKLGIPYLFLDPEYQGSIDFFSFFLVGLTYGGFVMSWNLTTYLLNAHHFPFLASLSRPFTKFCINNSLLPLVFFILYSGYIFHFQLVYESVPHLGCVSALAGPLCRGADHPVVLQRLFSSHQQGHFALRDRTDNPAGNRAAFCAGSPGCGHGLHQTGRKPLESNDLPE